MKNILLFESFSEEQYLIDKIYENWNAKNGHIFDSILEAEEMGDENEYSEDESEEEEEAEDFLNRELSRGELRALNSDLQVVSNAQLAAMYLKALGLSELAPEKGGKNLNIEERVESDRYLMEIPGMENFSNHDWKSGSYYVTYKGLADALGIKKLGTLTRTIRKFYLLLTEGSVASREEEVIYPKIISAFKFFKKMNVTELQALVGEEIKDPETSNVHRATARTRAITRDQSMAIGKAVYRMLQDFLKNDHFKRDICRVQKIVIPRISQEKGIDAEDILKYYREYLTQNRMLNKFNYCS